MTSEGPARGSVFTLRLPRVSPTAVPTPAPSGEPLGSGSRRVLIVEDNQDAREMLRVLLELAGHDVHEAEDGPRGVEKALAIQPDVALVDLGLPGLSGYEVARRIREAPIARKPRLIALTGYGQPEDRARSLEPASTLTW